MRLLELFKPADETKHVTFCFGRMNPPTIGHRLLFKTMEEQGGEFLIFVSKTQDKLNNPLDYSTKVNFLKKMFPEYASHIVEDSSLNTFPKVCSYLYEKGYTHVKFVAGDDRLLGERNMMDLLKQYNGVEGKGHGYYNFSEVNSHSCGSRCPDSDDIAGISATKARADAENGDYESFAKHTGAGQHTEELYNAVRKGLGIKNES